MKNSKNPLLKVLNFSGGKQSSSLLWMILLGKIKVDLENFVVLNANPGMENSGTYSYVEEMKKRCDEKGILFYTVSGPNLFDDLVGLKSTNKSRIDNPPYWTQNKETGKRGRLLQKCTQKYKIAPMDRKLREILEEKYGISRNSKRLGDNIVEKWIGFTYSEIQRIKPSSRRYYYFEYPLINLKWSNDDVVKFFLENKLKIPPRSVCNACFANGLSTLKEMYEQRPQDYEQAVRVDESVRDLSQVGIRDSVFVSNTLIPLKDLPKYNFNLDEIDKEKDSEEDYSCDSGFCFL